MHSEVDLAYLAGLIDGEGSIGLYVRSGLWSGHQIAVKITNTNIEVLSQIAHDYGARIHKTRKRAPWRDMVDIAWSTQSAVQILRWIQPYLRIKKQQCEVALMFAETLRKPNAKARAITQEEWDYRESLRLRMRELNKRSDSREVHVLPSPLIERGLMTCVHCKAEFRGLRKRMYCSNRCRIAAGIADRRAQNIKTCPVCHKEFPATPKQLYCCGGCAQRAIKDRKHT